MSRAHDIEAVIAGLRDVFARAAHIGADRITAAWPQHAALSSLPEPRPLPVTGWLQEASENAPDTTVDLVEQLTRTSDCLSWQQTYTADDLGQSFLDRYGWSLLVGPDAPLQCEGLLSGVLMLGPGIEYPVHKHAAEEVYVVLSGAASWKIGDKAWETQTANSVVHNPPWQPHGMRTDQGQPLLMAFAWISGTVEKSMFPTSSACDTAG